MPDGTVPAVPQVVSTGEGSPDGLALIVIAWMVNIGTFPTNTSCRSGGEGRCANPHDLRGDCSMAQGCAVSKGCLAKQVFIEQ